MNLENATSQHAKIFYARHMQPGTARYEDETILVDTNALKSMLKSGVGKPVYINHQPVDLANMKNDAAGYVTDAFYNELDGWGWFKILAIDDECHNAIRKGWSVSNAYRPTQWGAGGTKNNVPYDREVLNGDFTHLAIVPDPRYEDATIMSPEEFISYQESNKRKLAELQNSKPSSEKGTPIMFKLFKNKQEEVTSVDLETLVQLEDGKQVSVGEMVNAMKKNAEDDEEDKKKKKEEEDKENALNSIVEVDGKKMPVRDLINAYCKANKKNDTEEDEEEKRKDDEDKENALKKAQAEAVAAKKHFEELSNAHTNVKQPITIIETSIDQLARGKARYGTQAA